MRKNRKKLLCSALALTLAMTSTFSTVPVSLAEEVEITQDASQLKADEVIKIHAKGENLRIHAWSSAGNIYGEWADAPAMDADPVMGSGWYYKELPGDCLGFLILDSNLGKITPDDVNDKVPGKEYWFDNGSWSDTNPNGGTTPVETPAATPEITPTPSDSGSSQETPAPAGKVVINKVTPADKEQIKAGVSQTITVDATSTASEDGMMFYKYEIKFNGQYVGDRYYSKFNTYTFSAEQPGTYNVKISVQAHDEDNTTTVAEYTYEAVENGGTEYTAPPTQTPYPVDNPGVSGGNNEGNTPATTAPTGGNNGGNNPVTTAPTGGNNGGNTPATTVPTGGNNGGNNTETTAPSDNNNNGGNNTATNVPGDSITNSEADGNTTPAPSVNPSANPSATPVASAKPSTMGDLEISSFTANVASPQKTGSTITLEATAAGGTAPYKYEFYCVSGGKTTVIQASSENSVCRWKPAKAGKYTVGVKVTDKDNVTEKAVLAETYVIRGLSISGCSIKKKGSTYKIVAKTSGASGKVSYQFTVKKGSKIVRKTGFKSSSTLSCKLKAGKYKVKVTVKDQSSKVSKTYNFTAK